MQQEVRVVPSVERPDPPYLQIARTIRDQIKAGSLKDGDLLPPVRKIAQDWGVAHATAAKVLTTLRSEGLARREGTRMVVQTRGTLHHSARDRAISMHRTGKIYPPGHYAKIRTAELYSASDSVADALGISEGAPVIRRQRTTYTAEDVPISTSVSWFDGTLAAVAPLLLSTERIVQGTAQYVHEQTGRVAVATYVQHAAGFADKDEAVELRVADNSAILKSKNRFVDSNGAVVEYGESSALPDHWVYYEYTTEETE